MVIHPRVLPLVVVLTSMPWLPSVSANTDLSLYLKATSDWIQYGISETSGNPAIGVIAEYQLGEHWVIGSELRDAEPQRVRQRHREFSQYIGFEQPINEQWFSGLYFKHRNFPDSRLDWNYNELSWRLSHQDGFALAITHSGDYYDRNTQAIVVETHYRRPINQQWHWQAGLGNFDLNNVLDYRYGHIGIGWRFQRFSTNLSYHWNSKSYNRTAIGPVEAPGLNLSVTCHCF